MKNNKGFTLIEVLVVVLILAILSGIALSMLNSGGYRQKARDSQRVSDLKKMQQALELYYADNRAYPYAGITAQTWYPFNFAAFSNVLVPSYLNAVLADPLAGNPAVPAGVSGGAVNSCLASIASTGYYYYATNATRSRYVMAVRSETPSTGTQFHCASLYNCTNSQINGCNCATNCYAVQNP